MNEKITCPVCGETNNEINKTCKNQQCKWDLAFAKDGVFVGLSEDEITQYNEKLKTTRNNFNKKINETANKFGNSTESNKDKYVNNKVRYGKIINGKIIYYDELKGFGFIRGEDSKKYYFHISSTNEPLRIQKNIFVYFIECEGPKGLFAKSIEIGENIEDDDYDDRYYFIDEYNNVLYNEMLDI